MAQICTPNIPLDPSNFSRLSLLREKLELEADRLNRLATAAREAGFPLIAGIGNCTQTEADRLELEGLRLYFKIKNDPAADSI